MGKALRAAIGDDAGFDLCAEFDIFFHVMDETQFLIENECDKGADPASIESSNDHEALPECFEVLQTPLLYLSKPLCMAAYGTPVVETLLNSDSVLETAYDLVYDADSNGDATSGNVIEGSKPMTIQGILDEMSYEMVIYSYPFFKRNETGCLLVGYDFKYIRSRAGVIRYWDMAFENEYE
ncbi:hypothetical protein Syun_020786 [Stephania yunnanensis]|uniref:Uncharacterized protein n=1 Tax=Stephania yunnanensis TaxID=152371 RepID=A0AAP0IEG8_9MAGN